uniref:Ig-like domain-containing protein n=1 Tax=Scleropages formosus TaxID=113540 RepID=A0A8C9SLA9_SCLFO
MDFKSFTSPVCWTVTAIFTFPGVPQPVLSLQSGWTNMFLTETVTLRCDVQGISSHWVYKWYRDGQEIPISGDGDTYTILSAARSHSGQYQCRGELPERLSYFAFTLTCCTTFLLYIYTGERLSLTCTVDGDSTGWKYLWYKDTQGAVLSNTDSDRTDGSSYTINSAAPSHSGQYWYFKDLLSSQRPFQISIPTVPYISSITISDNNYSPIVKNVSNFYICLCLWMLKKHYSMNVYQLWEWIWIWN